MGGVVRRMKCVLEAGLSNLNKNLRVQPDENITDHSVSGYIDLAMQKLWAYSMLRDGD